MTHKIMVVDDNSATRRMVRNALQRHGHLVIEAPDGKTALELMAREHPRVVVQDLMLPDTDGFVLVAQLRNLAGPDVSILAFSGFVSKLDEARVSTVGFDDIIPKPIAPSRLVPLVEAHLPAAPGADSFGGGRRLVIADDDPMQLKLATFRLGRLGFAVEAVSDGRAALSAIQRQRPAAVVTDVMMPQIDGFQLAIAIRQDAELRDLPVLLVTSSYVEDTDRELARRAGANDLVLRTPELGEVIDLLRVTLDGNSAPPVVTPESVPELERDRNRRVVRQLERQVQLNTTLAKRCSALASELTVLTGISEAVLKHRDVDHALDEALAACFDAGGISIGALYLVDDSGELRVRPLGNDVDIAWTDTELGNFFGHERMLRDVIQSGRPMYLPSSEVQPDVADDLLAKCRAAAILVVPLVHLDRALGGLMMASRGREIDQEDWSGFAIGVATQITQVLAMSRVYQERERAEQRATEHAAVLDALLESAPDFVFRLDLDGTIRFLNREMPPHRADAMIGTSWLDYYPADQHDIFRSAMARMLATGEPVGFEVQTASSDASAWISARIGPIRETGKIVGAVLVARDVSDRKQTEMHLMLADRMASVGTLAAGVAHEINNPLASVIANLDLAVQDVKGVVDIELPRELLDELRDARVAAERVREIVRDLKIFSRAEDDRRGAVDVHQVLESTVRMAWNEIRHRAKLEKTFDKVPFVDANESRLGQVFLNLIVNAVQSIPEGHFEENTIRIGTSLDSLGRVVVTIADTGSGIPVEVRSRLFTPFFTTKAVGVGTGLGLAISHRIITSFGGAITFDSEVGKGTEFRVTLPAVAAIAIQAPSRATTRSPIPRRGRVLVVDDEELLTQAICRYLGTNHDVLAVNNGRAALDLLERGERYDVILCDLMMPQVTGMELFAAVQRMDLEQTHRIVFLTGGAFTVSARDFLDATPNRRLEKPFDLKTLRKLVNDLLQ